MVSRQSGFSLIELSIVIIIMSCIAVLGLEGAAAYIGHTAYATTEARLARIDTALQNYRKTYGYLPCPADRETAISDAAYGKEGRDGLGNCTSGIEILTTAPALYHGMVPVRDLNLPLTYAVDAYGSKFNYIVTEKLTYSTHYAVTADGITVRSGRLESTCSTLCSDMGTAAYFVFSPGYDRRGGISPRGSMNADCVSLMDHDMKIDAQNCIYLGSTVPIGVSIASSVFYDARFNRGTVENAYFDDLVVWRSKGEL